MFYGAEKIVVLAMMALQMSSAKPEPVRSFDAVTPCTASSAISDSEQGFHLLGDAIERVRATNVSEDPRAGVHSELRHATMPPRSSSAITDCKPAVNPQSCKAHGSMDAR